MDRHEVDMELIGQMVKEGYTEGEIVDEDGLCGWWSIKIKVWDNTEEEV